MMSLILLKCSEHLGVICVCICICTMQVLVHAAYPQAFHTASTSEMSPESGGVCNQTMILDTIVNKQKITSANWLNILDVSILLLLVTFLLQYRCKKSVTSGRLACFSSPPGEGVQAHWEPAKCVLYDSECVLLTSPDSQQQGARLSAGEKGGWEGQCRAPVCQRGPSILMPPTAEPSAGYCT